MSGLIDTRPREMKTLSLLVATFALTWAPQSLWCQSPHPRPPSGWKQDKSGIIDPSFSALKVFRAGKIATSSDLAKLMPPIYDQGQTGSCTGNGVAAILDYARAKQRGTAWMHPSRLFIYFEERVLEGTVNQDAGAQIRHGIDVITDTGACKESTWPYIESRFAVKPSSRSYVEAASYQALHGYKVDFTDKRSIRIALTSGYPVVFGALLYPGIDKITWRNATLEMPRKGERSVGGHCMVIVGHDDAKQLYKVRNSWGIGWGRDGHLWIPYDYIHSQKICGDFWVIDQAE